MPKDREIKQVIVVRLDLRSKNGHKIRKGKLMAQAAHATTAWLRARLMGSEVIRQNDRVVHKLVNLTQEEYGWLTDSQTKICLAVGSEQELRDMLEAAWQAGLTVNEVVDAGRTEFDGPTHTCIAIGPNDSEAIDKITGHLSLFT